VRPALPIRLPSSRPSPGGRRWRRPGFVRIPCDLRTIETGSSSSSCDPGRERCSVNRVVARRICRNSPGTTTLLPPGEGPGMRGISSATWVTKSRLREVRPGCLRPTEGRCVPSRFLQRTTPAPPNLVMRALFGSGFSPPAPHLVATATGSLRSTERERDTRGN